jgi:glycosyltransferase involved in cell wall biosynthesis
MTNPKISILIPIYNIEKHLARCLDSILSQTLTDIEIICVNDYSSDNCQTILENYSEKDSRIIVVQHSKNKSILQARKTGVELAKGDYILFVDGDDTLAPNACDVLYKTITNVNVEICHFPTNVIGNKKNTDLSGINEFVKPFHNILKDDNVFNACFIASMYNFTLWNKLCKTSLIKKSYQHSSDFYCNFGGL